MNEKQLRDDLTEQLRRQVADGKFEVKVVESKSRHFDNPCYDTECKACQSLAAAIVERDIPRELPCNASCPKCGHVGAEREYQRDEDRIRHVCDCCRHVWLAAPLGAGKSVVGLTPRERCWLCYGTERITRDQFKNYRSRIPHDARLVSVSNTVYRDAEDFYCPLCVRTP